jgi:NAD dependent epimerase/dehydratase family enzyme
MRFLIENKQSQGVYNLTSPNPITNNDFVNQLGKVLNKPVWFPVPAFLLKLILGEASTLALDGRQVFPKRLMAAGFGFKYDNLDFALWDLEK